MRISARRQPRRLEAGQTLTHKHGGRLRAVLTSVDPVCVMVHKHGEADELSWPIGRFDGKAELDVSFAFAFDVWFDGGAVWYSDLQADQGVELGEVPMYVSYERPPPLSPEMQAIQRMQQQNRLEREAMMERMRQLEWERNEARRLKDEAVIESDDGEGASRVRAKAGRKADKARSERSRSVDDAGEQAVHSDARAPAAEASEDRSGDSDAVGASERGAARSKRGARDTADDTGH